MKVIFRSSALAALLLFFCCGTKGDAWTLHAPVELTVYCPPTPARAEGKLHLVYELHVTNFDEKDVSLTQVEVVGDKSAAPIAVYEGHNLEDQLSTPGRVSSEKTRLGGGQRVIIYIWVTLDSSNPIPTRLRHRLTLNRLDADGHQVKVSCEGAETPVRQESAIVLQPPLRGANWVALNGPSNTSIHRRATMAVDGRTCVAQRFAIDWNQADEQGEKWSGDPHKNASYYDYGSEILAVADGSIIELLDNLPENVPRSRPPFTFERGVGNHIALINFAARANCRNSPPTAAIPGAFKRRNSAMLL